MKQNEIGLYYIIQKSGCFFMSCLFIAEQISGKMFNAGEVNSLWASAKRIRYIDENDNILNSEGVINLALILAESSCRIVEVATFKDGVMGWYSWVKDKRADFFIQKGDQSGPQKYHFYVVDKYGDLIWDPYEPAVNITGVVHTICYQVIKK